MKKSNQTTINKMYIPFVLICLFINSYHVTCQSIEFYVDGVPINPDVEMPDVCAGHELVIGVIYAGSEKLNTLSQPMITNILNMEPDSDNDGITNGELIVSSITDDSGIYDITFFEDLGDEGYIEGIDNILDTLKIMVHTLPTVTAGQYDPFCAIDMDYSLSGTPIPNGEGIEMGEWSDSPGVTDDNGTTNNSTATFNPDGMGGQNIPIKYTFTDVNGCVDSAMTTIQVNPLPPCYIDMVEEQENICESDILQFAAPQGPYTYKWNVISENADIMGAADKDTVEIIFNNTGPVIIGLEVEDPSTADCKSNCEIEKTVNAIPTILIDTFYCDMDLLTYTVEFTSNGTVTSDFGTVVDNNKIIDIPVDKDVELTTTSNENCTITTLVEHPDCTCSIVSPEVISNSENEICEGMDNPKFTVTNNPLDTYEVSWFGEDEIIIETGNEFTPMYDTVDTYTYYVVFKEMGLNCYSDTVSVTFTIKPVPEVDQPLDYTFCGDQIVEISDFTGAEDAIFSWSNDNTVIGLDAAGEGNIGSFTTAKVEEDTMAEITVIPNLNGCEGTPKTFNITIKPQPVINAKEEYFSCIDIGISLDSVVFTNASEYNWFSEESSLTFSGSGTIEDDVLVVGSESNNDPYIISVTTSLNGCVDTFTSAITIFPEIELPSIDIQEPSCFGYENGSIELDPSGGFGSESFNYNWSNSSTNNSANNEDLAASKYYVTISSGNCSSLVDSFTIDQPDSLIYEIASHFDESCDGVGDGEITLNASGGNGDFEFTLNNQLESSSGIFVNLLDTTYTIMVTDSKECPSQGDTLIIIHKGTEITENISFLNNLNASCEDAETITLKDSSTSSPGAYLGREWMVNLNIEEYDSTIHFGNNSNFSMPGTYHISAKMMAEKLSSSVSSASDCMVESNIDTAIVYDTPKSNLSISEDSGIDTNDNIICENDQIVLWPNITEGTSPFTTTYTIPNDSSSIISQESTFSFNPNVQNEGMITISIEDANGCIVHDSINLIITKNPNAVIKMATGIIEDQSFVIANEPISANATSSTNNEGNTALEYLWTISDHAIVKDLNDLVLTDPLENDSIKIVPIVADSTMITTLRVTDGNHCWDEETYENPITPAFCNFKVTGNVNLCQGEGNTITFEYRGAFDGSADGLTDESIIYLVTQNDSIPIITGDTLVGKIDGDEVNYNLESANLAPGQYSFAAKIRSVQGGCVNDFVNIGGGFKVIDRIDAEELMLSIERDTFCTEDGNEINRAFISGIQDIEGPAKLYYNFSNPLGSTIPPNNEFLSIDITNEEKSISLTSNLGTNQQITLNLDRIEVLNDIDGQCNVDLDRTIDYYMINCSTAGVQEGIDHFGFPNINGSSDENICEKSPFTVSSDVIIKEGREEEFLIKNVLVENLIPSESLDTSTAHIILNQDDLFEELKHDSIKLEYFKPYFVYTIVELKASGANLRSEESLVITFYPSPEHELEVAEGPFCKGQIIGVSNRDTSKNVANDNAILYSYEWDFMDSQLALFERADSTYIYLDSTNSSTVEISSTLNYTYSSNHRCSSTSSKFIFISDQTVPTPQKIYWWPGDILTSADESDKMCFQWGLVGGSDNLSTDPFLFTSSDRDVPSKFVDENGDIRSEFNEIYYLKTFHEVNESCPIEPACYTQVFFDKDQFNYRNSEPNVAYKLIPNPAQNQFYLNIKNAPYDSNISVEIFDFSGKRILSSNQKYTGIDLEFDISNINPGLYFVRISGNDNKIINQKLIIH